MDQVYYHTFFKHGRAATDGLELPWKRVHGVLPNDEVAYSAGLRTLTKLKNGERVFFYARQDEIGPRIAGWGKLRKLPARLSGWAVDFKNGSSIELPADEIARFCSVPTAPRSSPPHVSTSEVSSCG